IHLFDINILGNITFEELKTLTVGDIAVIAEIGDLCYCPRCVDNVAMWANDVVQSTGNTT
ncbi:hypothetical protein Tco_1573337, partial [Tanacetum coccineum]